MKGIDVIVEQAGSRYQVAVVRVLGQIDTTTSHELERRLQYLLKDQQFEIAIDLSKVSYISSAGWGIFISEIRGIRESGGDLKLAGMAPEVAEVFELLEFHNILESYRTVEAAVEKFERNRISQTPDGPANAREESSLDETIWAAGRGTGSGRTADEDSAQHTPRSTGTSAPGTPTYAKTGGTAVVSDTRPATDLTTRPSDGAQQQGQEGQSVRQVETARPATELDEEAGPATRAETMGLDSLICEIVKEDPERGCLQIRREISERGHRKPMSPLAMFAHLKRLNLESREKRKKYAESC